MSRILIIPHHPDSRTVRIRLIELAKALARRHSVSVLHWKAVEGPYTLMNRAKVTLQDFCKRSRSFKNGDLRHIEFPTLHRPVALGRALNRYFLHKVLARERFDAVINGSYYLFSVRANRPPSYIVDLADLPAVSPEDTYIDRYTCEEARCADAVTVVSHGLADYVHNNYHRDAVFLPNGTDLCALRSPRPDDVRMIRERYNLEGKCVIGYIGFIGKWVNIEMAIRAFRIFKQQVPQSVMLWIGSSPDLAELKAAHEKEDIIITGGIRDNIEAYFNALDIGILPHRESPFQDMAFHMKLVEYTAARKCVVSARLQESMRLGFPNVLFAEENEESWARALVSAHRMKWNDAWDTAVDPFDWERICDSLDLVIRKNRR